MKPAWGIFFSFFLSFLFPVRCAASNLAFNLTFYTVALGGGGDWGGWVGEDVASLSEIGLQSSPWPSELQTSVYMLLRHCCWH